MHRIAALRSTIQIGQVGQAITAGSASDVRELVLTDELWRSRATHCVPLDHRHLKRSVWVLTTNAASSALSAICVSCTLLGGDVEAPCATTAESYSVEGMNAAYASKPIPVNMKERASESFRTGQGSRSMRIGLELVRSCGASVEFLRCVDLAHLEHRRGESTWGRCGPCLRHAQECCRIPTSFRPRPSP